MTDAMPKHNFKVEELIKAGRTTAYNIEAIQEWLEIIGTIPKMSDEQVAIFLLACKNDVEATKKCIVCYFKYKAAAPEIFANRDIDGEEMDDTFNVTTMAIMPHRTKDNYAVFLATLKDTAYSNFNIDSQVKLLYLYLDYILYENPPAGFIIVINIKGVGLMHITRLKLQTVRKFFQFLQEALPTQLKQIHVLNTSYVFDKIIMVLKPFMNKELFDLIVTHPPNMNMDEFFEKYVPADLLPSDYGGNLPNLEQLSEETKLSAQKLKHYFEAGEQQIEAYKELKS